MESIRLKKDPYSTVEKCAVMMAVIIIIIKKKKKVKLNRKDAPI